MSKSININISPTFASCYNLEEKNHLLYVHTWKVLFFWYLVICLKVWFPPCCSSPGYCTRRQTFHKLRLHGADCSYHNSWWLQEWIIRGLSVTAVSLYAGWHHQNHEFSFGLWKTMGPSLLIIVYLFWSFTMLFRSFWEVVGTLVRWKLNYYWSLITKQYM